MKMAAPGGVCRIVGAALCGRPGAAGAHVGAPLRIAMGAGIFIGVSMIRRLTTANENDRKAPPEPIVGAALCGRPRVAGAHAGAPLRIAMGAGIFIGVSMIRRLTTANENDRKAPPEPIVGAALCGRPRVAGAHAGAPLRIAMGAGI